MFKSVVVCSTLLYLALAEVSTKTTRNEILLLDTGNILRQFDLDSAYSLQRDEGLNDRVSIVVSPIINNVAQGLVMGDGIAVKPASTPSSIVNTTSLGQLIARSISKLINKSTGLVQFGINSAARFVRSIVRFVVCTFVPICGFFNIFGDEEVTESLVTPEGVVRGLDFLEGFIEKYHALHAS